MVDDLQGLLRLAEQTGDDSILDELVHDTAQEVGLGDLNELAAADAQDEHISAVEAQASAINNGGFSQQIDYLLQAGVSTEVIEAILRADRSNESNGK
jgi:hypothetical protein